MRLQRIYLAAPGGAPQPGGLLPRRDLFRGKRYLPLTLLQFALFAHDVGMRLLDYERLYTKRNLSEDDISILKEHVSLGAALVEPLLGPGIAKGVLAHHERVDGRGYPNSWHGEEIPYSARLLQICDTFIAITEPVPFSCAPVMIVPVPSGFSFTYAPLGDAKQGHQPTATPIASSATRRTWRSALNPSATQAETGAKKG